MSPRAHRPLCVLTLGRSGSSLATSVLGAFGIELGPDEAMYPADHHNSRGYFELREVNALNDEILAHLGGSLWRPPAPAPDGWQADTALDPQRAKIRAFAARLAAHGGRWGFKDTRTVHGLALWEEVLGEMDYLICVRDPAEAVASLEKLLPEHTREELGALWLGVNALLLARTAGKRRMIVHYDQWFGDLDGVVDRLGTLLGEPVRAATRHAVRHVFDPAMRHERTARADDLPPKARALGAALRALAGTEEEAALDDIARELHAAYVERESLAGLETEAERVVAEIRAEAVAAIERAEAQRDRARAQAAQAAATWDRLSAERAELRARIAELEAAA